MCWASAGAGPRGWISAPETFIGTATVRNVPSTASISAYTPATAACSSLASSANVTAGPQISPASSRILHHSSDGLVANTSSISRVISAMLSNRARGVAKRSSSTHSGWPSVSQNGRHQRCSSMLRMR